MSWSDTAPLTMSEELRACTQSHLSDTERRPTRKHSSKYRQTRPSHDTPDCAHYGGISHEYSFSFPLPTGTINTYKLPGLKSANK